MWSFLWSSIQVLVLFLSICSFLVLVGREWRWISWTRNHVFHHGLAFSSLIFFSVFLSKSMCISAFEPSSSPSTSLVILLIHSAFLLWFWQPYFRPKSFGFFGMPLLVCLCVMPSQLLIVMSYFFCIVLPFVDISLISVFLPVLSGLFPQGVFYFLSSCLFLSVPTYSRVFLLFYHSGMFSKIFFICVFSRISHAGFDFFFMLFEGITIFSQTNFAPA